MTIPIEIREAVALERRRCIGVVLAEFGIYRLAGEERIAAALDALATKLEYPDGRQGEIIAQTASNSR